MRKIITSTVLILLFTMVSSSVFAGKHDNACGEFKGKKSNGLYGLCTAYQNALAHEDQEAMDDIFANWSKKVGEDGEPQLPGHDYGEPQLPGHDYGEESIACPCWASGENEFPATYEWLPEEGLVDDTSMFATYEFGSVQFFVEPGFCAYGNTISGFEAFTALSTSQEEDAVCVNDMIDIFARDF